MMEDASIEEVTRRHRFVSILAGLLPLMFWCGTLILGALGIGSGRLGILLTTWNLNGGFGLAVFVPSVMLVFAGQRPADGLPHQKVTGQWLTNMGLLLICVFTLVLTCNYIADAISDTGLRDSSSWSPQLEPRESGAVAVPYAVMALCSLSAIIVPWGCKGNKNHSNEMT